RRHTRFSRDWSSDVCSSDLGSNNHIVVIDCPYIGNYFFVFSINFFHHCHSEVSLFPVLHHFADRIGNGTRLQSAGCHLIHQWLEVMIIVFVYQNDLKSFVFQLIKKRKPSKTSSDNHHSWVYRIWNIHHNSNCFYGTKVLTMWQKISVGGESFLERSINYNYPL